MKAAVASHRGLMDYEGNFDRMLENPGYLSALLIYCQAAGIPFHEKWLEVLTVKRLPEMSEAWMEKLMQGLLFDDAESFFCPAGYREELIRRLKAAGLIEKKKVGFLINDKIEKILINSRGKLDSIRQIAGLEYQLSLIHIFLPGERELLSVQERSRLPENENQLHSLLMAEGDLAAGELDIPAQWLENLAAQGRVVCLEQGLWIAAEMCIRDREVSGRVLPPSMTTCVPVM